MCVKPIADQTGDILLRHTVEPNNMLPHKTAHHSEPALANMSYIA